MRSQAPCLGLQNSLLANCPPEPKWSPRMPEIEARTHQTARYWGNAASKCHLHASDTLLTAAWTKIIAKTRTTTPPVCKKSNMQLITHLTLGVARVRQTHISDWIKWYHYEKCTCSCVAILVQGTRWADAAKHAFVASNKYSHQSQVWGGKRPCLNCWKWRTAQAKPMAAMTHWQRQNKGLHRASLFPKGLFWALNQGPLAPDEMVLMVQCNVAGLVDCG